MIAARKQVADDTASKGHAANGKRRGGRARGVTRKGSAARKGPSVNCGDRLPCGESKPQLTPDPLGATDPVGADPLEPAKKTRKRRAWQPGARDHFIYHLVKFDGLTQEEAASRQQVSQATVSRIIDRYERWQAHADPREGGRLDPAERLRAQRWLTYERNELILGSALRIAKAVEGTVELWKTVRTEPQDRYRTDKGSVRDETTMIDRTGVAARFLRLAFKVNMEQLALVEKDPPPLPAALSPVELAEEERQDAAADAELAEQQRREEVAMEECRRQRAASSDAASELATAEPEPTTGAAGVEGERGGTIVAEDELPGLNLHNLNNNCISDSDATAKPASTCAADADPEKKVEAACTGESALPLGSQAVASTIRSFPAPASVATLPPGSPPLRGGPSATRRSP